MLFYEGFMTDLNPFRHNYMATYKSNFYLFKYVFKLFIVLYSVIFVKVDRGKLRTKADMPSQCCC